MRVRTWLPIVLCLGLGAPLSADTLILADGTRIAGTVTTLSQGIVTFRDATGASRRYRVDQIDAIEFDPVAGPRGQSRILAVPGGATLVVDTVETIDSSLASPAQTYAARVAEDVSVGASVLIPRGAVAQLAIHGNAATGATARAALTLVVQSISVDGLLYRAAPAEPPSTVGIPVKRRAFTGGFSQSVPAPTRPSIHLIPGLLTVVVAPAVAGVDPAAGGTVRIAAGARLSFTSSTLAALQADR